MQRSLRLFIVRLLIALMVVAPAAAGWAHTGMNMNAGIMVMPAGHDDEGEIRKPCHHCSDEGSASQHPLPQDDAHKYHSKGSCGGSLHCCFMISLPVSPPALGHAASRVTTLSWTAREVILPAESKPPRRA